MIENYEKYFNAVNLADVLECASGYLDSKDCSWYHRNWMTLRILGMVSNPFWHGSFFVEQLKEYYQKGKKILVLGTADFSMPLICVEAGVERLDICDICKTPLNICDKVALKNQFKWETFVSDICLGIDRKYDIIVNDAFLTRFQYDKKTIVLNSIGQALSPGGVYITTIRNDWNGGKAVIPTEEQKQGFITQAVIASQRTKLDEEAVRESASTYISHMISYPMESQESIKQMATDILTIKSCKLKTVVGECKLTNYFQVVFQKK
ncbi:MAG: class I SAM-dependent methyltransferase [Christensenellaceae bacterium]|jgi:hypothetical protein|nr:class I SAM-dependent methyltransferase [Christensenellaceae bacterium]